MLAVREVSGDTESGNICCRGGSTFGVDGTEECEFNNRLRRLLEVIDEEFVEEEEEDERIGVAPVCDTEGVL